jgi:hypothetical protein
MTRATTSGKADFDRIYNRPDARDYYVTLGALDYAIPQHGADVVEQLVAAGAVPARGEGTPTVLDVCCSYGVGGVLLTTDLGLDDLYAHYRDAAGRGLEGAALAKADRELLSAHRRPGAPRVIGLDAADSAVAYAVEVGALDDGVAANLESDEAPPGLARLVEGVDVVSVTGGVGYVTARTFDRLMAMAAHTPTVVAFCLREYDYTPVAESLEAHGLVTERSSRTFHQRRFADDAERDWALSAVAARGLDPEGYESDGYFHAELYVSRPADQVAARPLGDLLPGLA